MIKKTALFVLLVGLFSQAEAHRTWLLPTSTVLDNPGAWVTVDGAISENLFDPDTVPLKLDGLQVTGPDGAAVTPENTFSGKLRSSFDLKLDKPGTYKVSLVSETVMASYTVNGEPKRWRGSEAALHAEVPANAENLKLTHQHSRLETFITAGKPGGKGFKTSGVGIEMEPLTSPNDLRTGETAHWRFLVDGKPAAQFPFSLIPGGVRYRGVLNEIRLATDSKGEVSVTLPAAGVYWLNATYPVVQQGNQPAQASHEAAASAAPAARRLSYAATLEVLPQ